LGTGYSAFWAKAQPHADAPAAFHPLIAHALDVAAVATLSARRAALPDARTLGWLVALHDIGKFSRPFQAKEAALWPTSALGPFPSPAPPSGPAHDAVGLYLLRNGLSDVLSPVLPRRAPGRRDGWSDGHAIHLWRALAGHHGRPPAEIDRPLISVLCDGCRLAARDFVAAMQDVFRPPPLLRPTAERDVLRLAWTLAGAATLADWIGSRQEWFPYAPVAAVADPAAYFWNEAVPRAAAALVAAGLAPAEAAPFGGIRRLFPAVVQPTPVQLWAETVPLPEGPVLAVIEELTGAGKTEAAVTLAHRLLAAGRAQGLYVALPTMATANAMYGRLAEAYQRLFTAEARPSLALAHGRAVLNPQFRAAVMPDAADADAAPYTDPADMPAETHCAAWLAEDRRRALLAQVGVGTIDQALLAALPVRHATLRQHGLAGRVLIVDEAHAFDPYMDRELLALLRFQAALGGSAILLSATLPKAKRQALVDAFRDGLGAPGAPIREDAYPLATLAAATGVRETPCEAPKDLGRRVVVTRVENTEQAEARVLAAAAAGAAVAWVRNTVDDAIETAAALRARGLDPLLFHARFAMADRLAIERVVLDRFGRASDGEKRRCVLVATPIIEQSLDIDFDLLCTDLAPADLLIQRAGRLWRHPRARPIPGPELVVVSPAPIDDPPPDWIRAAQPGTAAIYRDPALLWRSARAVFGRGAIATPEDMRPLIEAAGADEVPAGLASAAGNAEGKTFAEIGIAEQNVLRVWEGYRRDAGLWEPDLRTPTRLEDRPQMTLRLARLRAGAVVPYAEDPDPARAWALSEVQVARFHIAACPPPAGTETAVEAARAQWGRWERESERVLLAVLREDAGRYTLTVRAESGTIGAVSYDAQDGLRWEESASAE
jgi:CRISPR-associated endonuclease/helicase Cas3